MEIREPYEGELKALSGLLDAYRVFYGQPSDPTAAARFLRRRMEQADSVIFVAVADGRVAGFTQLYPSFSSSPLQQVYILNDLFVHPDYRKRGLGRALLLKAQRFCRDRGAKGLALETAVDNPAQQLYELMGWKRDAGVFHYFWTPDTH